MTLEAAKNKLEEYGQSHVLKYYDELTEAEQKELIEQIEVTDMSILSAAMNPDSLPKKGVISPIPCMDLDEIRQNDKDMAF